MPKSLSESFLESINQDVVYPFFAIELFFDNNETLRLWSGDITLSLNGVDWIGTGGLLSIDSIEETSETSAKGATVTLSAIPEEVLSLALTQPYQNRVGKIYFGTFNINALLQENDQGFYEREYLLQQDSFYILSQDGTKIYLELNNAEESEEFDILLEDGNSTLLESSGFSMYEVFSGYMDQMNIDEGPETSTLSLMLENKLVRLEKASTARYTSAYQKSKYPNDKGFDFVEDLQTKEVYWGRSVS